MIELEIQVLSDRREGLLTEVGRSVVAHGFTLQRQRLTQDVNGALLTIVVRGAARKQRALEAALDAHERVISFHASTFVEGAPTPHFAASRPVAQDYVPPTLTPLIAELAKPPTIEAKAEPEPVDEPEPEFEFMLAPPPVPPPRAASAPAEITAPSEVIQAGPNVEEVEKALQQWTREYPDILPRLLALENTVTVQEREASLLLAGQRLGAWVFRRDHAHDTQLDLYEAIERLGIPALRALVEIEQKGEQLHIRNSPLCTVEGRSHCQFFSGYLEGLLGGAMSPKHLSVVPVCCRSYGADECVLALSD